MDFQKPHRRLNPLTGEWVLVSPHRTERPWQGRVEDMPSAGRVAYDSNCYLCPGNARAKGNRNPDYQGTYVFDNDFPALLADTPAESLIESDWMNAEGEPGICRVLCYSPRHDLTLGELELPQVRIVVNTLIAQVGDLQSRSEIGYVQFFENKGEIMGCSNPHPHCQLWATASVPNEVKKEDKKQSEFFTRRGRCLLCDVFEREAAENSRVVYRNDEWLLLVPFWANWPFETMLLPRRHSACLTSLDEAQKESLAEIWQKMLRIYDRLFGVIMPFSGGFHIAPRNSANREAWHLHAHFYPPLLRSATVRKFAVGYEMLAGPQRDMTAEQAAEKLRECLEACPEPDEGGRRAALPVRPEERKKPRES
jgi:UDPglucose--hexose-1-phosphate uridylyltransferase